MSEKVKLPLDVAEALDYATKELAWSIGNILTKTARRDWDSNRMQVLNNEKDEFVVLIAKALVNGYQVEETPEERIKRIFTKPNIAAHYKAGVIDALDALNMKIDGVNT